MYRCLLYTSSLNAFLDSELEQMLCFSTKIDAEKFCREKSAVFVVLPEEDSSKYFMVSLLDVYKRQEQTQHAPAQEPVPAPGLSL